MGFLLLCAGVALMFFLFQLLMARKGHRWPVRLLPLWLDLALAFYAFLRFADVLNYSYDSGFLDGGVLTGLILLIFSSAALAGIALCWLVVLILRKKERSKAESE